MNTNNPAIIIIIVIAIVGIGYFLTKGTNYNNMMASDEHHDEEMMESYEIYPGDVVEKIKNNEDIILLDVRTLEEYEETHLQNALLLPVEELSQQSLTDVGLGDGAKDKEIIIYCRTGARSKTAYDIMNSLGYTNIKSISGGMIHWEEDEYPFTETGMYKEMKSMMYGGDSDMSETGPRVSLDRNFHDFGIVLQYGGTVTTSFNVTNGGTEILTIGDITTSCSCTSATISSASIKPNESAVLTVVFDPNFHGEPLDVFKRTIFIPTNDPTNSETEVVIQVDIAEGK